MFSSVKTERNCSLKVSAFPLLSKINLDPFLGTIYWWSLFRLFNEAPEGFIGLVSFELAFGSFCRISSPRYCLNIVLCYTIFVSFCILFLYRLVIQGFMWLEQVILLGMCLFMRAWISELSMSQFSWTVWKNGSQLKKECWKCIMSDFMLGMSALPNRNTFLSVGEGHDFVVASATTTLQRATTFG